MNTTAIPYLCCGRQGRRPPALRARPTTGRADEGSASLAGGAFTKEEAE